MNSTAPRRWSSLRPALGALMLVASLSNAFAQEPHSVNTATTTSVSLDTRQQAILPIAAFAAVGDLGKLNPALNQGLDAGLSISEVREVLVQLYAYAGFPRSLNALGELLKVVQARKQAGIVDDPGREPSRPGPQGDALLAAGTANQTKLAGAPVQGPLFDFAPVANEYLRTHLFGDIFERDNLGWQHRELATVAMLAAMSGVEPQLQAHMRISLNTGLTAGQLGEVSQVLAARVSPEAGRRAAEALVRQVGQ
ncbi:carboxymuconolactone decarboxylase family protein [Pseudomonas fakonensis]|uniref:Carboxymuconolactone decarboxylase family protein n=1 Tax=Pseudomonas fakonensis TaxID=2842355 RepID=A0ABX8ND88_9PSED|nr:carboxymuconolactone decarboxylase family protein [Pseudomonas fakonensis]QXH53473.1 carboxymuconolactone decarboxylase family protein [Pseudomonas fakonensis]